MLKGEECYLICSLEGNLQFLNDNDNFWVTRKLSLVKDFWNDWTQDTLKNQIMAGLQFKVCCIYTKQVAKNSVPGYLPCKFTPWVVCPAILGITWMYGKMSQTCFKHHNFGCDFDVLYINLSSIFEWVIFGSRIAMFHSCDWNRRSAIAGSSFPVPSGSNYMALSFSRRVGSVQGLKKTKALLGETSNCFLLRSNLTNR